jgi:hypothetical protein
MIEIKVHFVLLDEVPAEPTDGSVLARIQIIRDCKDLHAALGEGTINVEPIE